MLCSGKAGDNFALCVMPSQRMLIASTILLMLWDKFLRPKSLSYLQGSVCAVCHGPEPHFILECARITPKEHETLVQGLKECSYCSDRQYKDSSHWYALLLRFFAL